MKMNVLIAFISLLRVCECFQYMWLSLAADILY